MLTPTEARRVAGDLSALAERVLDAAIATSVHLAPELPIVVDLSSFELKVRRALLWKVRAAAWEHATLDAEGLLLLRIG